MQFFFKKINYVNENTIELIIVSISNINKNVYFSSIKTTENMFRVFLSLFVSLNVAPLLLHHLRLINCLIVKYANQIGASFGDIIW